MARAITKVVSSRNVEITIRRIADGKMVTETYTINGRSINAAKAALVKQLKTNNFMVVSSRVVEGGDETRYTMDAETFSDLAEICEPDKVYGHDTITATFKVTVAEYYTMDSMEPKEFTYIGTTTERKLRKAIADVLDDDNILVAGTNVMVQKLWMPKETFVKYAKVVAE